MDDKLLGFVLNLVALVSTINSFRGYWYMMDEYYLTGNYVSSLLTGQLIGCLVLMALNATCSLHAGVIKEDKQDEPDSKLFDFFYSSYFYLEVMKYDAHRISDFNLVIGLMIRLLPGEIKTSQATEPKRSSRNLH